MQAGSGVTAGGAPVVVVRGDAGGLQAEARDGDGVRLVRVRVRVRVRARVRARVRVRVRVRVRSQRHAVGAIAPERAAAAYHGLAIDVGDVTWLGLEVR